MKVVFIDNLILNRVLFMKSVPSTFDCKVYSSAIEALEQLESFMPDVVIAEEYTQEIRGSEILMTASKILPNSLRILITARSDADDLKDNLPINVVHMILEKPYPIDLILNRINAHFGIVDKSG
jgi:response regulator RpfG family c-di-GMP phosphodiesterase